MKININQNDGTHKDKENRDFGVRAGFQRKERKYGNKSYGYGESSPFTLKNSLIITPHYEVEFELTGGVRYVKNHRNDVLVVGDRISVIMNEVKKIPILLKREIDKRSEEKKIIVAEVYNFDDIYYFHHDVSLFYDENKIDSVLRCVKKNAPTDKMIINSMSLGYSLPEVRDIIRFDSSTVTAADTVSDRRCASVKFDLGGASVSAVFTEPATVSYGGKFFSMAFTEHSPLRFSFIFS